MLMFVNSQNFTSFQKILLREHFMVSYGLSVLRYGMRRLAVRDCSARMQYRFRSTACCGMIGSPCSKFSCSVPSNVRGVILLLVLVSVTGACVPFCAHPAPELLVGLVSVRRLHVRTYVTRSG